MMIYIYIYIFLISFEISNDKLYIVKFREVMQCVSHEHIYIYI